MIVFLHEGTSQRTYVAPEHIAAFSGSASLVGTVLTLVGGGTLHVPARADEVARAIQEATAHPDKTIEIRSFAHPNDDPNAPSGGASHGSTRR